MRSSLSCLYCCADLPIQLSPNEENPTNQQLDSLTSASKTYIYICTQTSAVVMDLVVVQSVSVFGLISVNVWVLWLLTRVLVAFYGLHWRWSEQYPHADKTQLPALLISTPCKQINQNFYGYFCYTTKCFQAKVKSSSIFVSLSITVELCPNPTWCRVLTLINFCSTIENSFRRGVPKGLWDTDGSRCPSVTLHSQAHHARFKS